MKKIFIKSNYFAISFFIIYLAILVIGLSQLVSDGLSPDISMLISLQSIVAIISVIKKIKLNEGEQG